MDEPHRTALLAASALALLAPLAQAHDHSNLDSMRPARLEDAYAVAEGEIVLETGVDFVDERSGPDRFQAPLQIVWGALPNTQFEIGTRLSTHPHDVHEQDRPGDLKLGVLCNLNEETTSTPALGVKVQANLPTGGDSSGADYEVKGLATKSIDRLSLHLNASYRWLEGEDPGDQAHGWEALLGVSYPLGAPQETRTTILADVYVESGPKHGDENIVGIELGTRYQLTQRSVMDFGIGRQVDGPQDREDFRVTVGWSVSM